MLACYINFAGSSYSTNEYVSEVSKITMPKYRGVSGGNVRPQAGFLHSPNTHSPTMS